MHYLLGRVDDHLWFQNKKCVIEHEGQTTVMSKALQVKLLGLTGHNKHEMVAKIPVIVLKAPTIMN